MEIRFVTAESQDIHTLEESISAARCQHIMLETARTTPASEALYLTLGYRRTNYYGSSAGPDHCLCFSKDISGAR